MKIKGSGLPAFLLEYSIKHNIYYQLLLHAIKLSHQAKD